MERQQTQSNGASDSNLVLRCAWLVNPGELPQRNVRVAVDNGQVAEICPLPPDEMSLAKGRCLLPRFVNAHTHLEFSGLAAPLPPSHPFTDWIRSVVRYRTEQGSSGLSAGVHESRQTGSVLLGEICTSQSGHDRLVRSCAATGISAVSFREVIGFTRDGLDEQIATATSHCSATRHEGVSAGISPHAPYSVHPDLLEAVVDIARNADCPVAMHLAETTDELELLDRQTGRFVDFLQSIGIWDPTAIAPGTTALDYLQKLAPVRHALAVHGNYFRAAEISFLSQHRSIAVVFCPRTHRWFRHEKYPLQQFLSAGVNVILGTDSRASNPDLSIWRELQCATQMQSGPIWELLPLITTNAARAIGADDEPFRIQVGFPLQATELPCVSASLSDLSDELTTTRQSPQIVSLMERG